MNEQNTWQKSITEAQKAGRRQRWATLHFLHLNVHQLVDINLCDKIMSVEHVYMRCI